MTSRTDTAIDEQRKALSWEELLELKQTNPNEYAVCLFTKLPHKISIDGITPKIDLKMTVNKYSPTLKKKELYIQAVGSYEEKTTNDPLAFITHVYTMAKQPGMLETHKACPLDAILMDFVKKDGSPIKVKMSTVIDEKLIESVIEANRPLQQPAQPQQEQTSPPAKIAKKESAAPQKPEKATKKEKTSKQTPTTKSTSKEEPEENEDIEETNEDEEEEKSQDKKGKKKSKKDKKRKSKESSSDDSFVFDYSNTSDRDIQQFGLLLVQGVGASFGFNSEEMGTFASVVMEAKEAIKRRREQ